MLPGSKGDLIAFLKIATDLLDLVSWLSVFHSPATRTAYEFFLISSLLLLIAMFNGSVVKRVILTGSSPICLKRRSGRTLSKNFVGLCQVLFISSVLKGIKS